MTAGGQQASSILIALVLYRMQAEDSPAYQSLRQAIAEHPALAAALDIMICDNSPYLQERPPGFTGPYVSDISNPGLAVAYNRALRLAAEQATPWLLLLDQDTTITPEYLLELLLETANQLPQSEIVALVPKLLENGQVQSPHGRPTWRHREFDRGFHGPADQTLYGFNSAAVLRVSALNAIGGFPQEFWLDFLDHATFHLLQANGGRVFVLRTCLEHQLSANNYALKDEAGRKRAANMLAAELTFYRKYGNTTDRWYRRVRLMRGFLGQLLRQGHVRDALQYLRAALR